MAKLSNWAKLGKTLAWAGSLVLMAALSHPSYANTAANKEQAMAVITLGEADSGRLIEVPPGNLIRLQLPENPSTGYRWELEPFEGDVLKLQDDTYQPPATLAPGAGGVRVFDLLSRSPGTVLLRLRLMRPWEPTGAVAGTFEVTVQVLPGSSPGP